MPGFRSSERIRYGAKSGLSANLKTKPTEAGVSTLFFRKFGLDNGEPFSYIPRKPLLKEEWSSALEELKRVQLSAIHPMQHDFRPGRVARRIEVVANTKETRVTVSQKQANTFFRSDDWPKNEAQRHVRLTPRNVLTGLVTDTPEASIFQFGKKARSQPF